MGWNTYYGLGGSFNETDVHNVANFLVSSGLHETTCGVPPASWSRRRPEARPVTT
jgi:hypothetical protein